MRIVLAILLVISLGSAEAKNYYFSALSGNDSRTSSQAQSASTPWKTLNKLNSFFSSLQPGDSVLFRRGETFYGTITVSKSGKNNKPIVLAAYGSGNRPVITGMVTLSEWSSLAGGKYESYNASLGAAINMVTINGVEYAMGRYPNSTASNNGYLNFESHGTNSITDEQLTSSPGWKGAELVVRTNRYVIDRVKITAHSGNKISYSPALSYVPIDGFGYFIQNDIRTLDQFGEWYYNPAKKKITVYLGTNPAASNTIKASVSDRLVYVYNMDNIQFDNITFTGGNSYGFYLYSADNIVIKNCDISFSGIDAISANNVTNLKVERSNIINANNIALNLSNSTNGSIRNNQIRNTSLLQGMGQNNANKSLAIRETGKNNLIEYNDINSTGYIGIRFGGDYCIIKNNLVNNFNLTKDDGGGIYTSSSDLGARKGQKITGNIVLNGIGAAEGTNLTIAASTSGIYLDDDANNIEVTNNTVGYCNKAGILVHNSQKLTLLQNTVFNNRNQQILMSHNLTKASSVPLRNNTFKKNILFSKTASQGVLNISTVANDISQAGTMDSNYYCRPLDDNFVLKTAFVNSAGVNVYQDCDLEAWRAVYKKDVATRKTAVQLMTHKVNALFGSNKFANGKFNNDISGANVYSTGTSFTKNWVKNKIEGGTLEVITASRKPGVTTVSIPVGSVSTAKKYIIGFSVKNSKDTLMYVYARQAGAPYKVLSNNGVKTILRMGTARKDYELAFTPLLDEANTTIFLETPSQMNTWWLDNIRVYEANVTETNPDDSIRFEYNASQASKTIPLAGIYVDAKGTVYKKSIILKPYTSAILVKKGNAAMPEPATNLAPVVRLTSPAVNSKFSSPATIKLSAAASDSDGTIKKVEFFSGTQLIHTEFIYPYTFSWENVVPGNYTLTARAVDNTGNITRSAAVPISIFAGAPPDVSITSPKVNAAYTGLPTITLTAKATDKDGTIAKVDFYDGNTLLKTENLAPFSFAWSKVAAGKHTLTARATDNSGNVTISPAVAISVSASSLSSAPPGSSGALSENDSSSQHYSSRPEAGLAVSPDVKLFPNPVIDKIQISFSDFPLNQKGNLAIVDLLGKTVKSIPLPNSNQSIEVDISSLSTGIYVLRFSGENFMINKKFVKKN